MLVQRRPREIGFKGTPQYAAPTGGGEELVVPVHAALAYR
jgi:hypothetical protein